MASDKASELAGASDCQARHVGLPTIQGATKDQQPQRVIVGAELYAQVKRGGGGVICTFLFSSGYAQAHKFRRGITWQIENDRLRASWRNSK